MIRGSRETLIEYATQAYAAVSPPGSTTARCCDPLEAVDGTWYIGCAVCLSSSVPLPEGLIRVVA